MPSRKRREEVARLSYEKALQELKGVVNRLETETPPLEEAIELFDRGQLLAKHCADLLGQAELKVRRLTVASVSEGESNEPPGPEAPPARDR